MLWNFLFFLSERPPPQKKCARIPSRQLTCLDFYPFVQTIVQLFAYQILCQAAQFQSIKIKSKHIRESRIKRKCYVKIFFENFKLPFCLNKNKVLLNSYTNPG